MNEDSFPLRCADIEARLKIEAGELRGDAFFVITVWWDGGMSGYSNCACAVSMKASMFSRDVSLSTECDGEKM